MTVSPEAVAAPGPLRRFDVALATTDPDFQANIVVYLKGLGYPSKAQDYDDAARGAKVLALNQPNDSFNTLAELKKWANECARGLLQRNQQKKSAQKKARQTGQPSLTKDDVSNAVADPGFRTNLIGDVRRAAAREAYLVTNENLENAAGVAIEKVLSYPGGYFHSLPALRKWSFDSAVGALKKAWNKTTGSQLRSLDKGWHIGGSSGQREWWSDEFGNAMGVAVTTGHGKHTSVSAPLLADLMSGNRKKKYENKADKAARLAAEKEAAKEERQRINLQPPAILRADRGEFKATPEAMDDVWERIKGTRASLEWVKTQQFKQPAIPTALRNRGWAGGREGQVTTTKPRRKYPCGHLRTKANSYKAPGTGRLVCRLCI